MQARKRFGQHFLVDPMVIHHILSAVHPGAHEHWVEIGPGRGALTEPLLRAIGSNRLDVIEIDRDLASWLEQRFTGAPNLHIHQADVLTLDCAALVQKPGEKLRILGNLPYNISTPLLFHLLGMIDWIQDMHFMLQKEVVDRMAAQPGQPDYGRLSVMTQYFCTVHPLLTVAPTAFNPKPKVVSRVVRLLPKPQRPCTEQEHTQLENLVKLAFNQRRKMLRNSLSHLSPDAMQAVGINPNARAETLSISEFITLSRL